MLRRSFDHVEPPAARHALQHAFVPVAELETGAGDEVADGAREEYLAGPCCDGDAYGDDDRDARQFSLVELTLPDLRTTWKAIATPRLRT
jgi:hypothetical protein